YPLADIVTITVAVILIIRAPQSAKASYALIGAGVLALGISDSLFAYLTDKGTYADVTNLTSSGWVIGFLIIGFAGLRARTVHQTSRAKMPGYTELVLPYVVVVSMGLVN